MPLILYHGAKTTTHVALKITKHITILHQRKGRGVEAGMAAMRGCIDNAEIFTNIHVRKLGHVGALRMKQHRTHIHVHTDSNLISGHLGNCVFGCCSSVLLSVNLRPPDPPRGHVVCMCVCVGKVCLTSVPSLTESVLCEPVLSSVYKCRAKSVKHL